MKTLNKPLLLAVIAAFGLVGSASAAVLTITDGGFENVTSSGNTENDFYKEATDWFEQGVGGTGGGQTELFLSETRSDTPTDSVGEFWGTLLYRETNPVAGLYQQVGNYASGDALEYDVSYTIGDRSNVPFNQMTFSFYSVSASDSGTAADGTTLADAFSTETLLGSFTTSSLDGGANTASLAEVKNVTLSSPSDGDQVWLLISQTNPSGDDQSLVDNVSLTAVPEPSSTLSLLTVGLCLLRRRRA